MALIANSRQLKSACGICDLDDEIMLATKVTTTDGGKKTTRKRASKKTIATHVNKGFVQFGKHPSVRASEVILYLSLTELKRAYLKAIKAKQHEGNGSTKT